MMTMSEFAMEHGEVFEACRARLHRVATRILGSADDAEDVVQEASLRWLGADPASVRAPEAWLMTVVSRLSVDRARRDKRERRLREEAATADDRRVEDLPADDDELGTERVADAFALLRHRLAPAERLAFMLREVFGCDYRDVARALRKNEVACRQIVHRARTRVKHGSRRIAVCHDEEPTLAEHFAAALDRGDREVALAVLNERSGCAVRPPASRPRPRGTEADRALNSAA